MVKPIVADVAQLAMLFGITERRVQQLVEDGTLPAKVGHGKYDLFGCVMAYITYLKGEGSETGEKKKAKDRHEEARAEKAEIELEALKATLIPAETASRVWSDQLRRFQSKILSMAPRIAKQLHGKPITVIAKKLDYSMREALSELSEFNPDDYAPGGPSKIKAATATENKRVGGALPVFKPRRKR